MQRIGFVLGLMLAIVPTGGSTKQPSEQPHRSPSADHVDAEYAVRWLSEGTDVELRKTVALLRRETGVESVLPAAQTSTVTYYDVKPMVWPSGYTASLRKRGEEKDGEIEFELTYKVRGRAPLPSPFPAIPACAVSEVKREPEVDVTVAAAGDESVRNASISCSIRPAKPDAQPEPFSTTSGERSCKIEMTRYKLPWKTVQPQDVHKRKDLKLETWSFTTRSRARRTLIEASWKATTDPLDETAFRAAVQPLIDRLTKGAPPPSKERTAAECDADQWPSTTLPATATAPQTP